MSREELLALVSVQAKTIEVLTARLDAVEVRIGELAVSGVQRDERIAELEAENAELKRRLSQSSRNSSKPPSSDGPEQALPPRSLRRKTGRKPGKQPGAQGFSLELVDDPDEVFDYVPDCCRGCGADLHGAASAGVVRRQVTDIAPTQATVTEHRLHQRRCGCGKITTAPAPTGVADAPASYGPNLRAWVVYALVFQHIPVARVVELVTDLSGARPSAGWVCQVLRDTAVALAQVEKLIRTLLTAAHILHVDETGAKVTGARWWLHVAATEKLTTYHFDRSRGRPAITELGVLTGFEGIVVHDCWASYNAYTDCDHALCGAHITRELIAADEAQPGQHWPQQAIDALFALNTAAHQARDRGESVIPPDIADPLLRAWRHAILVGLAQHPARPGRKQSKTRNLLERLHTREADVLRFAHDLTVPFSNNQAERDLRPTKTQMKISGTFRSATNATAWARIRGYVSTARKHGLNAFDAIHAAVTGNPWTPTPSLTT
jgi:transposase